MKPFIYTRLVPSLILSLVLSGCITTGKMSRNSQSAKADKMISEKSTGQDKPQMALTEAQPEAEPIVTKQETGPLAPVDLSRFYGAPQDKNITHYVRGIMHDLVDNLHYVNDKTPIGVTSFVFLDSDLDQSDLLGKQIAESFIHEVHQFGIPVIDYKTTDYIRVTKTGDFIFSRDFLDLKEEQPIKYVLAGTLVKHRGGLLVNARIIGLLSKAVVASAQAFIPESITDGLLPSVSKTKVGLMQGE
ncbi:MAG: TolB-like protein [Phenylobacterium sp.]|jgi:TolB-like protein